MKTHDCTVSKYSPCCPSLQKFVIFTHIPQGYFTGTHLSAVVPMQQPWKIGVYTSQESTENDNINNTKS